MTILKPFPEFQLDVLKEVGNIGAGHAATALSKLLDKPVDMKVPKVSILPFQEAAEIIGGAEQTVVAVFLRVEGDVPGNLFFMLSVPSAKRLLHHFIGLQVSADDRFSEMERSAICEVGNILAGSYLSSLGDLTRLHMMPTVPALAIDMVGAIISCGLIEYGHVGDHALLIDTQFLEGCAQVESHFFLIPDPASFAKIFTALGVPYE